MKKKLFHLAGAILFIVLSANSFAQDVKNDIQMIQGAWGKEKRELVSVGMGLNSSDNTVFWPIYDSYEADRKKLSEERLLIINDYVNGYLSLNSASVDKLVERIFSNDQEFAKLEKNYYKKLSKALNPLQAAKFLQIETYFKTATRSLIQDQLPFIADLGKMKKH